MIMLLMKDKLKYDNYYKYFCDWLSCKNLKTETLKQFQSIAYGDFRS